MSSPRLEPWLMPETTRSGWKPSISPRAASRTQSTGVPSQAKPWVPSSKETSVTHSGRLNVIERAVAERLESGATTASCTSATVRSARRSVCRPFAPIPSSLVSSTRSIGSSLVGDGLEVEPVCGRRAARLQARAALQQSREGLDVAAGAGDLEHRPDEDAVHVAQERVGLDGELEHVAVALPAGARHDPLEAPVVAVGGGEGREVVGAGQERRAGVQDGLVKGIRMPERAAALERRRGAAREYAVAVGAAAGVAAGREAVGGPLGFQDGDLGGQQRVDGAQARQLALVGDDLPERVHAAV